jgi:hypothetical protein
MMSRLAYVRDLAEEGLTLMVATGEHSAVNIDSAVSLGLLTLAEYKALFAKHKHLLVIDLPAVTLGRKAA